MYIPDARQKKEEHSKGAKETKSGKLTEYLSYTDRVVD